MKTDLILHRLKQICSASPDECSQAYPIYNTKKVHVGGAITQGFGVCFVNPSGEPRIKHCAAMFSDADTDEQVEAKLVAIESAMQTGIGVVSGEEALSGRELFLCDFPDVDDDATAKLYPPDSVRNRNGFPKKTALAE